MSVIVDNQGNKIEKRKINSDVFYINLPENIFLFFIAFLIFLPFLKKFSEYYPTDNLKNNKQAFSFIKKRLCFESENKIYEIFLNNTDIILKNIKSGKSLSVCIVSEEKDGRIFKILEKICHSASVIYLMTDDELFYEAVSGYSLENYGITVCMRKMNEHTASNVCIALNFHSEINFSNATNTICLCPVTETISSKVLDDIIPFDAGDFSKIRIKKCQFMPKNCRNFNLIWRNCAKTIDKTKK